jgi:hypothetical protein
MKMLGMFGRNSQLCSGIVAGLTGSPAAAMLIRNLLFGTQTWDAFTLTAVAIALRHAHSQPAIFQPVVPRP